MALIQCRECGKQISDQAVACPHCGAPLQAVQQVEVIAPKKHSGCAVIVFGLLAAGAVATCVRGVGGGASSARSAPAAASAVTRTAKPLSELMVEVNDSKLSPEARKFQAEFVIRTYPGTDEAKQAHALIPDFEKQIALEKVGKQWSYSSYEDGMTGKRSRSARVSSSNSFEFDFPYKGKQHATLEIRKHPRYGNSVIFEVEKGQILCSTYQCPVRVRFDDGAPRTYSGSEPADHSSMYVFIPGFGDLTQRMARAKRMRVEVNIYNQGALQAEFDVEGLDLKRLDGR